MIQVIRRKEMLLELQADVNNLLADIPFFRKNGIWIYNGNTSAEENLSGKRINNIVISPTEQHLIKSISDKPGIVLAVHLAPTDSDALNPDDFSEDNNELFFVLEKIDPGKFSADDEQYHYAKMQLVMKFVKEWIQARGLNGNVCGGDETLSKSFHTEWEYQAFGGFNGLSVSFNLKDFEL